MQIIDSNDPYAFIKMNVTNQDDLVCDVCLEGEDFDDDEILICDLCGAGTH